MNFFFVRSGYQICYPHQLSYTGMINGEDRIDRRKANVLFDVCPDDKE